MDGERAMPNDYDDDAWPRSRTAENAERRPRSPDAGRDYSLSERESGVPPAAWVVLALFLLLLFGLVAMILVRVNSAPTTAPARRAPWGADMEMPLNDKQRWKEVEFQKQMMEEEMKRAEEERREELKRLDDLKRFDKDR
jgi:hypothetical protein